MVLDTRVPGNLAQLFASGFQQAQRRQQASRQEQRLEDALGLRREQFQAEQQRLDRQDRVDEQVLSGLEPLELPGQAAGGPQPAARSAGVSPEVAQAGQQARARGQQLQQRAQQLQAASTVANILSVRDPRLRGLAFKRALPLIGVDPKSEEGRNAQEVVRALGEGQLGTARQLLSNVLRQGVPPREALALLNDPNALAQGARIAEQQGDQARAVDQLRASGVLPPAEGPQRQGGQQATTAPAPTATEAAGQPGARGAQPAQQLAAVPAQIQRLQQAEDETLRRLELAQGAGASERATDALRTRLDRIQGARDRLVNRSASNMVRGALTSGRADALTAVRDRLLALPRTEQVADSLEMVDSALEQARTGETGPLVSLFNVDTGEVISRRRDDPEVNTLVERGFVTVSDGDALEQLRGINKERGRDLSNTEAAARNFIATANDALTLLNEQPDVNTFVGQAGALVNDLRAEARAVGRALNLEFESSVLDPASYEDTFAELGIDNRRMQSMVTSLAFQAAAARGQTGRAVSDRDVQRFVREVGASASDPRAFAATLRGVAQRVDREFRIRHEVTTGEPFEGSLGLDRLPGGPPRQRPGGGQVEVPDFENAPVEAVRQFVEQSSEAELNALTAEERAVIEARLRRGE